MANPNPTVDELEKKEDELFRTGPLSVLTTSVKTNTQVSTLTPSVSA
jgi:small nuclear ribonucleoprotein D2